MTDDERSITIDLVDKIADLAAKRGATIQDLTAACLVIINRARELGVRVLDQEIPEVGE